MDEYSDEDFSVEVTEHLGGLCSVIVRDRKTGEILEIQGERSGLRWRVDELKAELRGRRRPPPRHKLESGGPSLPLGR